MREIRIFNHEMFGDIRTMTDEKGETFFVGKDVATALGYKNPSNALQVHVDEEDKTSYLIQVSGSNYKANTLMVNESGLYALVLSSKLPQAKVFKHWVTSEVLPQIRKTGGYIPTKDGEGRKLSDLEIMAMALQIQQKTIEAFNRLPEEFTSEDVERCFGTSGSNVQSKIFRLMKDHLIEKMDESVENGKTKPRTKYKKTGLSML